MAASFGGILAMMGGLGVLIGVHEAGHFLAAKMIKVPVRQFAFGFGPKIVGFQWGETECRVNWIPLGGYCAFADDVEDEDEGAEPIAPELLLRNRPIWQRTWVVSAGVIFNLVLAWFLFAAAIWGQGIASVGKDVVVSAVSPDTPAAAAGLRPGDQIVKVDGQTFADFDGFKASLGAHAAKPTTITVTREGKPLELAVTPTAEGRLGFLPKAEVRPVSGPVELVSSANEQVVRWSILLPAAIAQLVTDPVKGLEATGGPVMIVAMGDQMFQQSAWRLVEFAAILSVELFVINLLPLPALDGGHLVLLAIEKVRRRPLPRRIEERILVAGFVTLMGLGMMLIIRDIFRLPDFYRQMPGAAPAASAAPTTAPKPAAP